MDPFTLPALFVVIGTILGGIITGFFYFFGIFGRAKASDIKSAKEAADFVSDNLERKITILDDKINDQSKIISIQGKRIEQIEKENKILKEVLQGKDEQTQVLRQQATETMSIIPIILNITQSTNQSVKELAQSIDTLVKALNIQPTMQQR
jgi:hypothetical protein